MSRLELVRKHLARLRSGYIRSRSYLFALGALAGALGIAAGFVVFDLVVHFPILVCWLFWLAVVGVLAAGTWMIVRTVRARLSDSAVAALVEAVLPHLDNHLINAVQLSETGPGAVPFVEELLSETDLALEAVQPRNLYSRKPLTWVRRGLVVMTVVLGLSFALTPRGAARSLLRLLVPMAGLEPYSLTRIAKVAPGDATVLRGASVAVQVELGGVIPEDARIVWDRGRGKTLEVPLAPAAIDMGAPPGKTPGTTHAYTCTLKGVFYESRYRVLAGDAFSPWYRLLVTNPPGLDGWEAEVKPPEYTRRERFRLNRDAESMEIPEESSVVLRGTATADLSEVRVVQGGSVLAKTRVSGKRKFSLTFPMRDGGPVRLLLQGMSGLEAEQPLPFVVLLDQPPNVILPPEVKPRTLAARDAKVPVAFQVSDDYGIRRIGLARLGSGDQGEDVTAITPPGKSPRRFQGRFLVDMASFGAAPGDNFRFRVWAEDGGPPKKGGKVRRGMSRVFEIGVPAPEEQERAKKEVVQRSKGVLLKVIQMQRANLRDTRRFTDVALTGREVDPAQIQKLQAVQKTVRDMSSELVNAREALGDLATVVAGLVNHEMADVLTVLGEARRAVGKETASRLTEAVKLETRILAALTGVPAGLNREQQHQEKVALLERLRKIVAGQMQNLKDSKAVQKEKAPTAAATSALSRTEDQLANDLVGFADHCSIMIEQRVDDDFAAQIRQVYDLLDKEKTYEKMLTAAEALEARDLAAGVQGQSEALRTLMKALDILNRWRVENAKKIAKNASEVLKEVAEKLGELEEKQAKIAEVTRDLASRGKLDDEVRKKLAEMDKEQESMADMVEKLAQDLYQFPELPVCNELNSKMREVYEDVEQAMDSENAPALEIAVQKEDALLDAIRNTKERVEDVEMWLPDVPDHITWNMESFDTDEFPDMPLVPLPDELEDIVGDLLDQAQSEAQQSQDTTGNNMIADMEMGWGVMDGPMPSFSAKGKSGNTRPNDNEMTGRSGAGREGQSNGELVENRVKGLEGTKTHARRTRDPFQKGQVTEDEDSTLDAKATGGGKLGGESESIGMFGKAPRRDLNTREHGVDPTKLRQETEAVYATARLLYLGTGSLGTAARDLRGLETQRRDLKTFDSLHRKVLRRLEDTQVELDSGVVLPMPVASVSQTGGAATEDVDVSKIGDAYRDIVSDYYRSLGSH
ncbi:MAG: hypothetical protein GXP31_13760 [Kiritimatiellaeota bacterium]|nr:hypothetical protein [Kiritimatiellota bacterium]